MKVYCTICMREKTVLMPSREAQFVRNGKRTDLVRPIFSLAGGQLCCGPSRQPRKEARTSVGDNV